MNNYDVSVNRANNAGRLVFRGLSSAGHEALRAINKRNGVIKEKKNSTEVVTTLNWWPMYRDELHAKGLQIARG